MKSSTQEFTKVAFSCIESTLSNSSYKSNTKAKKTKLNLFGKGITYIKVLTCQQINKLSDIKQIDLSHNAISSIENIKVLGIEQLNLSHNKLQDEQRIIQVLIKQKNSQLSKNIKKMNLKGNPFIKKSLSTQIKRYLFSIQNDLDLFTKDEYQYLDLLIQRFVEKIMLQNLLNKVLINLQFIQQYNIKFQDDYQTLILMKPQDYFKILKRQMQWKIQSQPFTSIKKQVVINLPLQLFSSNRQKSQSKQYASSLVLQLRKRNQNLIKQNKQTLHKIQNAIFNYLTQKKLLLQKQHKYLQKQNRSLQKQHKSQSQQYKRQIKQKQNKQFMFQSIATPIKMLSLTSKQQQYPQINTPIYTKKISTNQLKPIIIKQVQSQLKSNSSQQKYSNFKTIQLLKQQRNPFDQIIRQQYNDQIPQRMGKTLYAMRQIPQGRRQIPNAMRQISQGRRQVSRDRQILLLSPEHQKIQLSPKKQKIKRIQIKNSSKTLFELSQSLLQKPVISSDQSLNFELQDGINESHIQKMFKQILIKLNPIYNLLYSPIESLKGSQKSTLINNLLQLLKQKLKYIQKLQRYKMLYQGQRYKYQQLMINYKKQKQIFTQIKTKNIQIKQQLKQLQQQISLLSIKLQSKTQFCIKKQENNIILQNKLKQYQSIKQNKQQQQSIEEQIIKIKQSNIKKYFINLLNNKSYKLYQFNKNINLIHHQQNKSLLTQYFIKLHHSTQISKHYKSLKNKIYQSHLNNFINTLKQTISFNRNTNIKSNNINKFIRQSHSLSFLHQIASHQQNINKNKIAIKHYHNKIQSKLFYILHYNYQIEKTIQYDQIVQNFKSQSKKKLKKWVFQEWLVWQKGLLHKQVQLTLNHQSILACNVIGKLCQYTSKQKSHQAKSLAVQLFLRDIRKINSFHKLYLFMSTQTQKWKLKLFKINIFTKRTFFDDFVSGIRFKKNQRKIKQKDHQMTKRKLEFNQLSEFKLRKKLVAYKTKNKLRACYFMMVKQQIQKTKKQIEVENLLKNNKFSFFFDRLKTIHKVKQNYKSKIRQVQYLARPYRSLSSKQFFIQDIFQFMRRRLRFKRSFKQFFINKNRRLLEKTFYNFRINCLQQKALFFEDKLRQLGPDIDLIEERQIKTNIEKVSLAREIQLKNQQLDEYQKQVNELRLLLQAKQIKYQKLKDLYSQSIQINSRQIDFYEIQKSILPQIYDYKSNLSSKNIQKQDHFQKTIRFDSKNQLNKHKIYSHTGYSPQRDIKMSKEKRKVNDYVIEANKISDYQLNNQKNQLQNNKKNKISDFYPSFRRF